jgi:hypothetical protein
MPRYLLTLTLTNPNKDRTHPSQKAREKADANSVVVHSRTDNNGTVSWDVTGSEAQVCEMIRQWKEHPENVTRVTSEPTFNCPYLG